MEVWRDINDFPNYQVSNLGNVKNKKRGNILKPVPIPKNKGNYICYDVRLYNDEWKTNGKHCKISRLVAEAFLPKIEGKNVVDHINCKPADNRAANLRWTTQSENLMNQNNTTKPNNSTGVRNITINPAGSYVVTSQGKNIKTCHTLEEAKKARKDYLNGLIEASHRQESPYGKYVFLDIEKGRERYRVQIRNKKINYFHRFNTLEEAQEQRDIILSALVE